MTRVALALTEVALTLIRVEPTSFSGKKSPDRNATIPDGTVAKPSLSDDYCVEGYFYSCKFFKKKNGSSKNRTSQYNMCTCFSNRWKNRPTNKNAIFAPLKKLPDW